MPCRRKNKQIQKFKNVIAFFIFNPDMPIGTSGGAGVEVPTVR